VAAAGKGRVLVADQDRRAGRRPDPVPGAVDEAEQVPDVEDVMPEDRELDRAVEPLLTCTLTSTRCRRRALIVDLGRPGHGLEPADERRTTPWLGRRSVPPLDASLLERPSPVSRLR
jgi:hypothetical protein